MSSLKGIARLWLLQNWMQKIPLHWIVACNFTCLQISIHKVCNIKHSVKCNLNAIKLKYQNEESKELPGKNEFHYQICISIRVNIHRAVKKPTNFSNMSDISHTSQVYADRHKQ